MERVNVHEARTHLSAMLSEVESQGKSFVVCRHGKPVARLVPYRPESRLTPHPLMSQIELRYDPTEALTEAEWPTVP